MDSEKGCLLRMVERCWHEEEQKEEKDLLFPTKKEASSNHP